MCYPLLFRKIGVWRDTLETLEDLLVDDLEVAHQGEIPVRIKSSNKRSGLNTFCKNTIVDSLPGIRWMVMTFVKVDEAFVGQIRNVLGISSRVVSVC